MSNKHESPTSSSHGPDASLPKRRRMVHRAVAHIDRRSRELQPNVPVPDVDMKAEPTLTPKKSSSKGASMSADKNVAKASAKAKAKAKANASRPSSDASAWLDRLANVRDRLKTHAKDQHATGLTEPDPESGEQWTPGQVWAHLGEFVPYWVAEWRQVLELQSEGAPPFGRTKADAGRIAAIQAGRGESVRHQFKIVKDDLRLLKQHIHAIDAREAWGAKGTHSKRGVMDSHQLLQEFLVGHLEQHADQLDDLAEHGAERAAARPIVAITAFVEVTKVDPAKLVETVRKAIGDRPSYVTAAELDADDAESLRDLLGSDD